MTHQTGYLTPTSDGALAWGELVEGILIRRYKRFLADVQLADGQVITAHTANTGTMLGCSEPGRRVWLSPHDNPARKYRYTLEMIEMPTALVGVNTGVPNRLVATAIRAGRVVELPSTALIRGEVTRGASRLDLLLQTEGGRDTLIEIKNCSLAEKGIAYFPDAVTVRGVKHLEELARLAREGLRAVIFIVVQRGDAELFRPADHIDPAWGAALRSAMHSGVELLVYQADLDLDGITLGKALSIDI